MQAFWLSFLAYSLLLSPASAALQSTLPSADAARQNAFLIFNAIHSTMRQWGSSLHHNGLSFFIATVPEGTVTYHGARQPERPSAFHNIDWLAFDMEHSQLFARSATPGPPRRAGPASSMPEEDLSAHQQSRGWGGVGRFGQSQQILGAESNEDDESDRLEPPDRDESMRGFFHIYRAQRPLNLIYLDGQAAAKSTLGTCDSQDLILLEHVSCQREPCDERVRAYELCRLIQEWSKDGSAQIDGFVRLEAGFEIMYCDFREGAGLDLISVRGSPWYNDTYLRDKNEGFETVRPSMFEWLRVSAQQYHGMPAGRVEIDWSSMVSAFSYADMNLTNPNTDRPDLPRVASATLESRRALKTRLRQVFQERLPAGIVGRGPNWQTVVDLIVDRYSTRIFDLTYKDLTDQARYFHISSLIDAYIDYRTMSNDTNRVPESELKRSTNDCSNHWFHTALVQQDTWTPEDHAIYAAILTVSQTICSALFQARETLLDSVDEKAANAMATSSVQSIFQSLSNKLKWTTWKECGGCASVDEICMVPMFPMGTQEDFYSPRCKNISDVYNGRGNMSSNYWRLPDMGPGRGREGKKGKGKQSTRTKASSDVGKAQ